MDEDATTKLGKARSYNLLPYLWPHVPSLLNSILNISEICFRDSVLCHFHMARKEEPAQQSLTLRVSGSRENLIPNAFRHAPYLGCVQQSNLTILRRSRGTEDDASIVFASCATSCRSLKVNFGHLFSRTGGIERKQPPFGQQQNIGPDRRVIIIKKESCKSAPPPDALQKALQRSKEITLTTKLNPRLSKY